MMNKKEILNIVTSLEREFDKNAMNSLFSGNGELGCGQFRNIARECAGAECVEEIVLMFDYTVAKADGISWNKFYTKNKTFGKLIKEKMDAIISGSATDEEKLKNLELFFGYMYWQSRIWASKAPKSGNSGGKNNRQGNGRYNQNSGNNRPNNLRNNGSGGRNRNGH